MAKPKRPTTTSLGRARKSLEKPLPLHPTYPPLVCEGLEGEAPVVVADARGARAAEGDGRDHEVQEGVVAADPA